MFLQHILVFSGKQKIMRTKVENMKFRCIWFSVLFLFFTFPLFFCLWTIFVFQMAHIGCLILAVYNWVQNDKEKPKTEPAMPSREESDPGSPFSLLAAGQEIDVANIITANYSEDSNIADYLKMIDENPNNPLFLKKYAQFLFQVRFFFLLLCFFLLSIYACIHTSSMIQH